jgi:ankyrin repeat protein
MARWITHTISDVDDDGVDHAPVTLAQWTALHACVRSKNTAAMKILLQHHAKTEIKDVDGETPLFVASTCDHPETVQCSLDHGANPNAMAQDGWTCLMMAARDGDHASTKALLRNLRTCRIAEIVSSRFSRSCPCSGAVSYV